MKINKELTQKYYETYTPCSCGDCIFYKKHIESEQPELCAFLKSLGVPPVKPYELISLYHPKEKRIEYLDCAYLVIGTIEDSFEKVINGIKITCSPKEKYPKADIQEEYFILTFGPVVIPCLGVYNRHLTYNDKVAYIKQAIDAVDPMGLLSLACPKDEYLEASKRIADSMQTKKVHSISWKKIQEVFFSQFEIMLSRKTCLEISIEINSYVGFKDDLKDFEECEVLKGKVSMSNCEITLKVHEGFIVEWCGVICINGRLYDKNGTEEADLLEHFCSFVEDDVIYVQYKHKHFVYLFSQPFRFFKVIQRKKYDFNQLKHKEDIELIFDNKGILYGNMDEIQERKAFDNLDFMIAEYNRSKMKTNVRAYFNKFFKIHQYICKLEEESKITVVQGNCSLKHLKEILDNDGPEYAEIIYFKSVHLEDQLYEIGVCVRGIPMVKKVKKI